MKQQAAEVQLWELRRTGNPRPVHSMKRRRARRRKAYFYRALAFLIVVLCLVLIYFMTCMIYRVVHRDTDKNIVEIVSEKIVGKQVQKPGLE